MDLTTELLDNAAFREAKRGYNTQDVDEFIEQVKAEYTQHDARMQDARQRVEAAEARVTEAERQVAAAAATAGVQRSAGTTEMEETLKRTLVLAQRTADAAINEADEQAARTLKAAQDQAARMLADAEEASARAQAEAEGDARRAQEEARARVLGELRDLEAARDHLNTDVDVLGRHLQEQRDRIRHTTLELQRLLDDPSSLREIAVPTVSEIVVPDEPAATIGVLDESPSLIVAEAAPEIEEEALPFEPPSVPAAGAFGAAPASADEHPPQSIDLDGVRGTEDDAYLAELRKAMTDESPLGPREDSDYDHSFGGEAAESGRSRFGRRR